MSWPDATFYSVVIVAVTALVLAGFGPAIAGCVGICAALFILYVVFFA